MSIERKRKTLDDFFVSTSPERSSKSTKRISEASPLRQTKSIPGLQIYRDFVSAREEEVLLAFLSDQEWRTDLARRVIHYGGTYCLMPHRAAGLEERQRIESTVLKARPMPREFDLILDRMIGQDIYTHASVPEFCIVNEYIGAQGISAHVENFRFKSPVCGLSLSQGGWIRFHELVAPDDGSVRTGKASQAQRTGGMKDVWLPQRSLLVMSGEAREKWQHEIVRSKRDRCGPHWKRVSLTFRTEKERS